MNKVIRMKVMCIGHAAYDITIPISSFIKENEKHRYDSVVESGGGPACTAAYLLGKWNVDVSFVGTIGNDSYGKQIMEELEEVNVDVSQVQVLDNEKTSASFILVNGENGSRTIISFQNPNLASSHVDIKVDADIILFDGQEYEITKSILTKNPNIISVMDIGRCTKETLELAHLADYVICSKEFAETVTQMQFDLNDTFICTKIYNILKEMFKGKVVITLEDKGCLYEEENEVKILPAISVVPMDTTGAGDIFHGAFVYALISKMTMKDALLFSNIAAGLSTKFIGTRNSIVAIDEVMKVFYEIK